MLPTLIARTAPAYIKTAAALIIGDEILTGKTLDRNSHYFAQYCFELGIDLKRVEVIPDDENDIIEASRRLVNKYDLVVTSGGIGPTHDDITYASIAKSFHRPLAYHTETLARMDARPSAVAHRTEEQRTAQKRMALFPEGAEVLFVAGDLWVVGLHSTAKSYTAPVVRVQGKLCIFPGIPSLFQKMLDGLKPYLSLPPPDARPRRVQVFTSFPESFIAPYLTHLQARVRAEGIRIGSYPVLQRGVYVSLIGINHERVASIAVEVERELQGKVVREGAKGSNLGQASDQRDS